MTDILLGLIALATLTTALLQIVVIVRLVQIAGRARKRVDRLSRLVAPLGGHATEVGENLKRALSLAGLQLDRVASAYAAVAVPLGRIATTLTVARSVAAVVKGRPRFRSRPQSSSHKPA